MLASKSDKISKLTSQKADMEKEIGEMR